MIPKEIRDIVVMEHRILLPEKFLKDAKKLAEKYGVTLKEVRKALGVLE